MTLVNQPTARPTRKIAAVLIAGMLTGAIQSLLKLYWPDHPFAPFMEDIDIWLQGAVMLIVGYLTKERQYESPSDPASLQGSDDRLPSQPFLPLVWQDEKGSREVGIGEQTPKGKGESR